MAQSSNSGGIGFGGLLFIALLVLKLTHVINWSWWIITSPLWGGILIGIIILIMIFIIGSKN